MDHLTAPEAKEPSPGTRERVTGPFKGYHVASLGCRVDALGGGGFLGYYKICRGHPENYWKAEFVVRGCCSQVVSSGGRAMRMAEGAAAAEIDGLRANGPDAGWGYGCDSMIPFLREQREARAGEQFLGDPKKREPGP